MKKLYRILSYVLVAAVGFAAACGMMYLRMQPEEQYVPAPRSDESGSAKLTELEALLDERFIGDVDRTTLEDGAAQGMIAATGDRWSYYISAEDYAAYVEQSENAYVGIGVTIRTDMAEEGFEIISVVEDGPADQAGIRAGDIISQVEGQNCAELGQSATKNLIRGKEGTEVRLTILRDGQTLELTAVRKQFDTPVATWELLDSGYGLIKISNFDAKCADETIEAIRQLMKQNAKGLIFDVRYNPGGRKDELVEILDYILPEGPLFRSVDYLGNESVDYSDASCIEIPMVVLVNEDSYSAAEFFAAALQEYDAAEVIGTKTCGKGYFQMTFRLSDGSAAAVSVGKYFTPQGISLADVGVTPDVKVAVEDEVYREIYTGTVSASEDPQVQEAVRFLNGKS